MQVPIVFVSILYMIQVLYFSTDFTVKVSSGNTKTVSEICSELTVKTPKGFLYC